MTGNAATASAPSSSSPDGETTGKGGITPCFGPSSALECRDTPESRRRFSTKFATVLERREYQSWHGGVSKPVNPHARASPLEGTHFQQPMKKLIFPLLVLAVIVTVIASPGGGDSDPPGSIANLRPLGRSRRIVGPGNQPPPRFHHRRLHEWQCAHPDWPVGSP
jgi:hypothetical protein